MTYLNKSSVTTQTLSNPSQRKMSFLGGRGGNSAPSGGVNLEKVEMAVTEYVILVLIFILLNCNI